MSGIREKDIKTLRSISRVAGIFTLIVSLLMIFSFFQLKNINPLDNPALVSVKEQFDKDPDNTNIAEQVRAMDLMARKAYFATRRGVETGSYLLLAGAIIFILCQRLIDSGEKKLPSIPGFRDETSSVNSGRRKYILIFASVITLVAVICSFILRKDMPDLRGNRITESSSSLPDKFRRDFKPDKINYPAFRGPDSRGIAGGSGYPTAWDGESGINIKWKTSLSETGKSSPIVWGNKIFVTGTEGTECRVICFDKKDGKRLWTVSASGIEGEPSELPQMDPEAGLAVPTAATDGRSVCAIFANGNLICTDPDGNKKWAKNLGTPENVYGFSSSLLIFENILIVKFDANSKTSLEGLDVEDGDLKWETIRQGRPTWSSPVIGFFDDIPQVIINGNPDVSSYDPFTGRELWAIECMSGDVAPSVAVNRSLAFAVTDFAKLVAIKPGQTPSIIWEDNSYTPDVSSPVATDDYLFISTGYGDVACYDAAGGDTLWTHIFMDQFYASPVIADGKVYFLDRSGTMHIVKADDKYDLIAEPVLGEPSDCTPSFSDKCIFIRTRTSLYCISAK